jgi:hypothetical protein
VFREPVVAVVITVPLILPQSRDHPSVPLNCEHIRNAERRTTV